MMTIVDDLVSVDELIEEKLTAGECEQYVQSCDIQAFNKICKASTLRACFPRFPACALHLQPARVPWVHQGVTLACVLRCFCFAETFKLKLGGHVACHVVRSRSMMVCFAAGSFFSRQGPNVVHGGALFMVVYRDGLLLHGLVGHSALSLFVYEDGVTPQPNFASDSLAPQGVSWVL